MIIRGFPDEWKWIRHNVTVWTDLGPHNVTWTTHTHILHHDLPKRTRVDHDDPWWFSAVSDLSLVSLFLSCNHLCSRLTCPSLMSPFWHWSFFVLTMFGSASVNSPLLHGGQTTSIQFRRGTAYWAKQIYCCCCLVQQKYEVGCRSHISL